MKNTLEYIREGFLFMLTCFGIILGAIALKCGVVFVGLRYPHVTFVVCCTMLFVVLCWLVGYARENW